MIDRRLLMVEDDSAFRAVYGGVLRAAGYTVIEADDRPSAEAHLNAEPFPVVLLDLMLPPDGSAQNGIKQMRSIIGRSPGTKVIVASGVGDSALMVDAVRAGAYDFLTKPVDPDVLLIVVERAMTRCALEAQVVGLKASLDHAHPTQGMIGQSPAFVNTVDLALRVARADLSVLITGESGTGKELLARAIHENSPRADRPFVVVNCAGLPETLLESAMFGHIKGAFTGAHRDRAGLFAAADTGTMFLDEIGDMPASLQVKLLRALESGEILPVGADQPTHVDVRLVSATHRDLETMQREGRFRDDLYWRIRGAEVRLPPLRERASDIPLLAQHFLTAAAPLTTDGQPRRLSAKAEARLKQHQWPGNLRELRNEMRRATVLAGAVPLIEAEILELRRSVHDQPGGTLAEQVEALERRVIESVLADSHGNRSQAARQLGLSRQGLLNKLQRFGLS